MDIQKVITRDNNKIGFESSLDTVRIGDTFKLVARDHAQQLAKLFPYPHNNALTLSRGRLHLSALLMLARKDSEAARRSSQCKSWREVYLEFPEFRGSKSIFESMPFPIWGEEPYKALDEVLQLHVARKALSHLVKISPQRVLAISLLPEELRDTKLAGFVEEKGESALIASVVKLAGRDSLARQEKLVTAVKRSRSRAECCGAILKAVPGLLPGAPALPFRLPAGYFQVRYYEEAVDVSKKLNNCLADTFDEYLFGGTAVVVRETDQPAIFCIHPLVNGAFCVSEVRGKDNSYLEDSVRAEIINELKQVGKFIDLDLREFYRPRILHWLREWQSDISDSNQAISRSVDRRLASLLEALDYLDA